MSEENTSTSNENNMDQPNFGIILNLQYFTTASISILELSKEYMDKLKDEELPEKNKKSKQILVTACDKFLTGLRKGGLTTDNDDSEFDQGRLIKKVFYATRHCSDKIKSKDELLLSQKDENSKIITILPGINLGFGYKHFDDEGKKRFWEYMYLLYISTMKIIFNTNEGKKNDEIDSTVAYCETELSKTGVNVKGNTFNPFVGLNGSLDVNNYDIENMFTGVKELPKNMEGMGISSVLNLLGVEKLMNSEQLDKQLKDINDDQINDATDKITQMLGASGNPEVKDVCNILIKDIVENLKINGISNLGATLENVAKSARNKIDSTKMKNTAASMTSFMENSKDKLSNLKDKDGNPINSSLLNSLTNPLLMAQEMAKQMNNNKK